jgi:Na+/phosphate symporter
MIIVLSLSLIVCLVGLVMYAVYQQNKPQEIGRIMFFMGGLTFLLRVGPQLVDLLRMR